MDEPIRNLKVGTVLTWVGLLLALVSFLLAKKGATRLGFEPIVSLAALFVGLPLGSLLVVLGKALGSRDAENMMRQDNRPPVLFLRSFRSDGVRVARSTLQVAVAVIGNEVPPSSLEEILQAAFEPVGPMVAIGRPGEVLATPGAARSYVADDEWQEVIRGWMSKASVVVLELGGSHGLWWELREAFATRDPAYVLLFIDPKKVNEGDGSYEDLMKRAEEEIGRPLPRSPTEAAFIWFDDNGRSVQLSSRTVPWWTARKAAFWGHGTRREQAVVSTLKPVVDRYRNGGECR